MAQRTEKEEAEFKVVPETLNPCVNNCGLTGNPATNNMCQKCFNASTSSAVSASAPSSSSSTPCVKTSQPRSISSRSLVRTTDPAETSGDLAKEDLRVKDDARRVVNRCSGCRRKVGLTGFRCRCGELFCAEHRYSDRHDCSYDYKSAGRDRIARENPVVKAAKIVKL